jgi:hypothetical protein
MAALPRRPPVFIQKVSLRIALISIIMPGLKRDFYFNRSRGGHRVRHVFTPDLHKERSPHGNSPQSG